MFTVRIESASGEMLTLTGRETEFQVASIIGLSPTSAQINTTEAAGMDGALFNSARLNTRNIVILLKINGAIEANRLTLYRYFRTKGKCTFYFANGARNVKIEGYVDNFECDLFEQGQTAQISILCPQPYFQSVAQLTASSDQTLAAFTFPFTINEGDPIPISETTGTRIITAVNDSEVDTGCTFEVDFNDTVNVLSIKSVTAGAEMIIEYPFEADDRLVINTKTGEKSAELTRAGTVTNIFPYIAAGTVFFSLVPGVNQIEFSADGTAGSTRVDITVRYNLQFGGV